MSDKNKATIKKIHNILAVSLLIILPFNEVGLAQSGEWIASSITSEAQVVNTPAVDTTIDNKVDTGVDNPVDISISHIGRGEAVSQIVRSFDLTNKYAEFISGCLSVPDECFFVFSAMSDYDGIGFNPLDLYPDVRTSTKYYDEINTATILGLVNGYLEEEFTPFHPKNPITRIQALKVVMGAAVKILWKEKFEIAGGDESAENIVLPFNDVDPLNESMWWYPRYLKAALENGVISTGESFRPNDPITRAELSEMINNALK